MKAILACEKNGGIGYQGSMPWPFQKKDLARFKELTLNKTIYMGRGTWESEGMPKPLPNRHNVIVSTQKDLLNGSDYNFEYDEINKVWYTDGVANTSIGQLFNVEDITKDNEGWIIGGAGLIKSAWHLIDELHLSHLHKEYECDVSIDLDAIREEFYCVKATLCMTHTYEIWKRK